MIGAGSTSSRRSEGGCRSFRKLIENPWKGGDAAWQAFNEILPCPFAGTLCEERIREEPYLKWRWRK